MKHLRKTILALLIAPFILTGCDGLLKVDSEQYIFPDEYTLGGTNDSIYSLIGICSRLQKLADSYVILGELRGDLVDVTRNSNHYLREINNFEISKDNPYAQNQEDYYAVINNCNYIIQNTDTSTVRGKEKPMYKLVAAVKAIRAWTYLQMVLNYETVSYYENPILSIQDAEKKYPVYDLKQLLPVLIEDLKPWKGYKYPYLTGVYDHSFSLSFFPVSFVLGDLYLWNEEYQNAANEYRDLMVENEIVISSNYQNNREVVNNAFTGDFENEDWVSIFSGGSEVFSVIAASNEYEQTTTIDSLAWNFELKVSDLAVKKWASQYYVATTILDTLGDLRALHTGRVIEKGEDGDYYYVHTYPMVGADNYMMKYLYMSSGSLLTTNTSPNRRVITGRNAMVYLRYAEAVNRMGKPHLALCVLKYGLGTTNVRNKSIVPINEISNPLPHYVTFKDSVLFDRNVGIRNHGCGDVRLDNKYLIIPAGVDTVKYVEDMIIEEAALELATEGNRFHDLMRIALRRDDNDYLATRVASKHGADSAAVRNKLFSNRNLWYIK